MLYNKMWQLKKIKKNKNNEINSNHHEIREKYRIGPWHNNTTAHTATEMNFALRALSQ